MRKFLMSCAVVTVTFALSAVEPIDAFVRAQPDIAKATSATSNFIEVKHSTSKARPPGWSRGRKVGWHGRRKPPGQTR
jgi:hypothetical protein